MRSTGRMVAGRAPIVAVEGPSAVGKSSVAALLARRLDAALIAEAADRIRPPISLRFADDAGLVRLETRLLDEEARRYAAAVRLAERGTVVVADTGFLGPVSYTAGLAALGRCRPATFDAVVRRAEQLAGAAHLGLPDLTVYLTPGSAAALLERAERDPVRHPEEFRERHRQVGAFELAFVRPFLARRRGGRVVTVSAGGPVPRTAGKVYARARGARPASDRTGPLERLLGAWRRRGLGNAPAVRTTFKKGSPSPRAPRR